VKQLANALLNINSAGKRWSQACRPITETLRHLQSKTTLGAETKDLASLIVSSLQEIDQGVEESAAWEKRIYFLKADQLRTEWPWAGKTAVAMAKFMSAGCGKTCQTCWPACCPISPTSW
jgi:hypothetical protein